MKSNHNNEDDKTKADGVDLLNLHVIDKIATAVFRVSIPYQVKKKFVGLESRTYLILSAIVFVSSFVLIYMKLNSNCVSSSLTFDNTLSNQNMKDVILDSNSVFCTARAYNDGSWRTCSIGLTADSNYCSDFSTISEEYSIWISCNSTDTELNYYRNMSSYIDDVNYCYQYSLSDPYWLFFTFLDVIVRDCKNDFDSNDFVIVYTKSCPSIGSVFINSLNYSVYLLFIFSILFILFIVYLKTNNIFSIDNWIQVLYNHEPMDIIAENIGTIMTKLNLSRMKTERVVPTADPIGELR